MKKLFAFLLLAMAVINAQAQFEVNSQGQVKINPDPTHLKHYVEVGTPNILFHYDWAGIYSTNSSRPCTGFNVAVVGDALYQGTTSTQKTIGILGVGGNSHSNNNTGVMGFINSSYGAGIVGSTTYNYMSMSYTGKYSAYLYGPAYATGSFTAQSFLTTSDINLKENITALNNENDKTALESVMDMNVVKYNYKKNEISKEEAEITAKVEKNEADLAHEAFLEEESKRLHFGLIAQELQTIYPNLVVKGQDGYLSINYTELVPVLIKSIQELKQEINELKGVENKAKTLNSTNIESESSASLSHLYQNTPNPFKERTTIRFKLADDVQDAYICIFDMQGKTVKKITVSSSQDSITVNASEIGEGMFLYTLITDGREIDTKRMILTR